MEVVMKADGAVRWTHVLKRMEDAEQNEEDWVDADCEDLNGMSL